MSSFVVIPGMRAVSVAAWWRRSWGRNSAGAPVATTAARQALEADVVERSAARSRRQLRLRRVAVDAYLDHARVKPGELRHLHQRP